MRGPLVTHSFDVSIDGTDLTVVASYWRTQGRPDLWRLEAHERHTDEEGDYFTPRPDLALDIVAEAVGDAEDDRRQFAQGQRDLAAPHLAQAATYEAHGQLAAGLVQLVADVGSPAPPAPARAAPEPVEPAPAGTEAPKVRDPLANITPPLTGIDMGLPAEASHGRTGD